LGLFGYIIDPADGIGNKHSRHLYWIMKQLFLPRIQWVLLHAIVYILIYYLTICSGRYGLDIGPKPPHFLLVAIFTGTAQVYPVCIVLNDRRLAAAAVTEPHLLISLAHAEHA
jgi:hypothetical protein